MKNRILHFFGGPQHGAVIEFPPVLPETILLNSHGANFLYNIIGDVAIAI